MSASEPARAEAPPALSSLPRFDLACLFDDEDEPAEVTVFPASDDRDISTNWITVDVDTAVSIEHVR